MSYGFFSLSPLMDWYFYTSANGERQWAVYASWFFYIISINGLLLLHFCKWRNGHVAVYASWFFYIISINGLLLLHFCKWRNGHVAVYASWFFYIISINGLLLLHFCKWRNGHVAVYSSLFFSSSPLTDCYFYTSANGEWQVAVYVLWFLFLVSIDGLLLLHFCKWRTCR